MKFAIVALVLALAVAGSDAWLYGGWGGYGLGYGYGYGLGYGGLWNRWGYGGYYGKRSTDMMPEMRSLNRTECMWNSVEEKLSCKGVNMEVQCSAEVTWPEEYNSKGLEFALGLFGEERDRLRILPRKLDNTAYTRGMFVDTNGVEQFASLYFGTGRYGLRLLNETCYERLTTLFKASLRYERVFVEEETETTYVIGDLVVFNPRSEREYDEYLRQRSWERKMETRDYNEYERDWTMNTRDFETRDMELERDFETRDMEYERDFENTMNKRHSVRRLTRPVEIEIDMIKTRIEKLEKALELHTNRRHFETRNEMKYDEKRNVEYLKRASEFDAKTNFYKIEKLKQTVERIIDALLKSRLTEQTLTELKDLVGAGYGY